MTIMFHFVKEYRKVLGVVFLAAVFSFTFGHTFFTNTEIANADVGVHVDETPHAPDTDNHVPCPTELHRAVNQRTTNNDNPDQHFDSCAPTAFFDVEILEENQPLIFPDESDIPPDLPLDQKTVLLI